ncbi:MAG: GNAT family N-acetyltransferase [Gammaproteobacteria bacterium]|nr:GNAT family N-acetyltransferase [Gammaproteobacteria bacterium]
MSSIRILSLKGEEALSYLPALAKLRIEVFREFPYLYDGSMAYEEKYLKTYIQSPDSVIVVALDGEEAIGASTALPLRDETIEFQQPFRQHGYDIPQVFYLGESVLRRSYRGQGLGVAFFTAREAHAQSLGDFPIYTFCAVDRPVDHPRRPADFAPLDDFWNHRGYVKHPELHTFFTWKEIDEDQESKKKMVFWLKTRK